MRIFSRLVLTLSVCALSCRRTAPDSSPLFETAYQNGQLVNQGFNRCLAYLDAWLAQADPKTGLIPENLAQGKDIWNSHNAAADNYPFMVLTAYLLDSLRFHQEMKQILQTERSISSRLGVLPDAYSFSQQDFSQAEVDTSQIIFGSSEYMKDGLIPLTEYLGTSPWSERMIEILDALSTHITVAKGLKGHFFANSADTEVNGELLQILARVYWITGNEQYLDWAIAIGDYYLLEQPELLLHHPRLRLRDHGCEVIAGLSELYASVHFIRPEKKNAYQAPLHALYDRILEVGRTAEGMFYDEVNMQTGEVVVPRIVDNWGYLYNAYYTLWLLDKQEAYRAAALKPLQKLYPQFHNFDWENGSSDGFADAIESGLNLFNRAPNPNLAQWINEEILIMWSLQDSSFQARAQEWKGTGIIEGWHGDGNFARTTVMYCLWKTQDLRVAPWREDVIFGVAKSGDSLFIALQAKESWRGTLIAPQTRYQEILHLPIDYPRINQFPQWSTFVEEQRYILRDLRARSLRIYSGAQLKKGVPIAIKSGEVHRFILSPKK